MLRFLRIYLLPSEFQKKIGEMARCSLKKSQFIGKESGAEIASPLTASTNSSTPTRRFLEADGKTNQQQQLWPLTADPKLCPPNPPPPIPNVNLPPWTNPTPKHNGMAQGHYGSKNEEFFQRQIQNVDLGNSFAQPVDDMEIDNF